MASFSTNEEQAEREAADWFAQLNSRRISTPALEAFHAWRRVPANDAAYGRVEAIWEIGAKLRYDPHIARAAANAHARGARRRRWRNWARSWTLPLGGLAAVGAAALYLAVASAGQTYQTKIGEQQLVTLEDGTRVRLDTDTRLRVKLGEDERDIRLVRGQAFFEVAHDAARPFIVSADDAKVRAIGTRFDVRLINGAAQVTLVEGAVEVRHGAPGATKVWRLAPGQAIATGPAAAKPAAVDVAAATSWTAGQLVFQATPLADAVAEVNRYSHTKVTLDAGDLGAAPVNGKFDTGDTEAFVAAVCDLFNLSAERPKRDEIRLSPRA